MTQRPKMYTCCVVVALATLALPGAAAAQGFAVQSWKLTRVDTGQLLDEQTELDEFFNQANCECDVPLDLEIIFEGDYLNTTYEFQIVAGQSCLDTTNNVIRSTCRTVFGPVRVNTLPNPSKRFVTTTRALMEDTCSGQDQRAFQIAMYTNASDPLKWEQGANPLEYTVDTVAPDQPRNASLKAGEGQVTISFDSHTSSTGDTGDGGSGTVDKNFKGYQALCETLGGQPCLSSPKKAEFRAAINVCGGSASTTPDAGSGDGSSGTWFSPDPIPRAGDGGADGAAADTGPPDAGPADTGPGDAGPVDSSAVADQGGSSGSGAASLDARYVCSEMSTAAGEIKVTGLENGQSYRFYLVTIDDARNPSEPVLVGEAQPELAEDLWERYKRLGGEAEPGYCFVATAVHGSYDHPHVRTLRRFRDEVLLPSDLGRRLVRHYYATSPPLAAWLSGNEVARAGARVLLWPVTVAASAHLNTSPLEKGLVLLSLLLGAGLVARRTRRRAP